MHTNHDVPYLNSLSSEIFTPDEFRSVRVGIKVNDITNDAEIPYLSIRQRNCRFPFETDGMKVLKVIILNFKMFQFKFELFFNAI